MRDGFQLQVLVYILSSRSGTLYVQTPARENRACWGAPESSAFSSSAFTSTNTIRSRASPRNTSATAWCVTKAFKMCSLPFAREKQLKRCRREEKIALIERLNPGWQDLAQN